VSSNAEGARLAGAGRATGRHRQRARRSEYGLHVVAPAIQDDAHNRTRFAIVTTRTATPRPRPAGTTAPAWWCRWPTARRGARHAGAAEEARRVDDPLRVAPGALGPVGVLLLHRHRRAIRTSRVCRRAEGAARAPAPSSRCWAPTPSTCTESGHTMFNQLGVIGCGLMGGSLRAGAQACRPGQARGRLQQVARPPPNAPRSWA
jgi:hypothetical protein